MWLAKACIGRDEAHLSGPGERKMEAQIIVEGGSHVNKKGLGTMDCVGSPIAEETAGDNRKGK